MPNYFANGGDRKIDNTPEMDVCDELEVEMLWGIGGDDKANSSSSVVKRAIDACAVEHQAFKNLEND